MSKFEYFYVVLKLKNVNGNSAYIILVILLGSQSGKVGLFAQGNQDSESGK